MAPEAAIHAVRVGHLTVLQKPDGGVRGILVGDVVRRLIARTMAQQMSTVVSIDGVGAFDLISRGAMLQALGCFPSSSAFCQTILWQPFWLPLG